MTDFRRPTGTTLTHASIKEYALDILCEFLTLEYKYKPKTRMLAFKCHCQQYFEINQTNFMNNVKQLRICDGAVGPCPNCNPRVKSALRFELYDLPHRLQFPSRADKKPKKDTDSDSEDSDSEDSGSDDSDSDSSDSDNGFDESDSDEHSDEESDSEAIPSLEAEPDDDCFIIDIPQPKQTSKRSRPIVSDSEDSDAEDPHPHSRPPLKRLRRRSEKE
jgi:hypothetical protein